MDANAKFAFLLLNDYGNDHIFEYNSFKINKRNKYSVSG